MEDRIRLGIFLFVCGLFGNLFAIISILSYEARQSPIFLILPSILMFIGVVLLFWKKIHDKYYMVWWYKRREKRKKKEIKYPESQPKSIKEIKYPKIEEERETSESENERLKESS